MITRNININKTKNIMETKSYSEVMSDMLKAQKMLILYDALIANGIAKKDVPYFKVPCLFSGYSMGEEIIIRCNGKMIEIFDNTKEYPKSCNYKAKHGKIVVDFTKKELKEYVQMCKERSLSSRVYERLEEMHKLVKRAIDMDESVIKKLNIN